MQLDEHGDLGAQHVGAERLEDVVDRACRVATEDVLFVLGDRGDEDDRDVFRALALLDQLRRLEAVEQRHLDVEQDDRDVVEQQLAERLFSGMGVEEVLLERLEDGLQRKQVLRTVVDEQDVGHPVSAASCTAARSTHSP